MHTFKVVKERFGWAVHLGDGMSTPFWSLALAIREANLLCEALRRHGVAAEVTMDEEVIETTRSSDPGGSLGRDPQGPKQHAAWR